LGDIVKTLRRGQAAPGLATGPGVAYTRDLRRDLMTGALPRGREAETSHTRPLKRARNRTGDDMPLYEHVFIARQDLSNTQAEGLIEHFGTILSDNGGSVVGSEYWGVKTMAYKINKNRKGHYAYMRTDAPSAAVQEMERLMRLHDDVMRVLTVKVDGHEEGPSAQMQKRDDRDRGERRERR
jgi:small subunit ribosomal protein S6